MTISLKADASGNFGSILINGTEAVRVNPGGIPASSTAFTPAGNIAATNVQAAFRNWTPRRKQAWPRRWRRPAM